MFIIRNHYALKGVFLGLALLLAPALAQAELWGSTTSRIYHLPTCHWVVKIRKESRIRFANATEAKEAGYRPCETCRPPRASRPGAHHDPPR